MPKDFKLPSDTPKYDGLQEPKTWLDNYLMPVRCQGGSKTTAMQSLQLQLKHFACAWLKGLPDGSVDSWSNLVHSFVRNFLATYKRPASIEELRACAQSSSKSIRSYIQRWTILRNTAEDISEEKAIDPFNTGLRRRDLKEELGFVKPKTIAQLMDIANRWADGEDSLHNGCARWLGDEDREARYQLDSGYRRDRNSDRRMKRKEEVTGSRIAIGGHAAIETTHHYLLNYSPDHATSTFT